MPRRAIPAITLALGMVAGLISGLLGVGGGILMVPMLVAVGLPQHRAQATSLAAIIPIAIVGAWAFAWEGNVDFVVAALLVVGSLAGAPLGARIMAHSSEGLLKVLFGSLMVAVAVLMVAT